LRRAGRLAAGISLDETTFAGILQAAKDVGARL
jgi:hypothetical protein